MTYYDLYYLILPLNTSFIFLIEIFTLGVEGEDALLDGSSGSEWGRAPFLDEKFADSVLPVGSVEK